MENRAERNVTQLTKKTEEDINQYKKFIHWSVAIVALLIVLTIIFFGWRRLYKTEYVIDEQLWGTLGDFVGGFFGTILSLGALYLMYLTFRDQLKSSDKAQQVNEQLLAESKVQNKLQNLQIFDTQFQTFYKLYEQAKNNYRDDYDADLSSDAVFDSITVEFKDEAISTQITYGKRKSAAVTKYEALYAKYRQQMSLHWRMLYQLMFLISDSDIDEAIKVRYAKAVRGNLNPNEMLLLRYNAYSQYGEKMQPLINEYNLLKHLPLTSLKEFKKWEETFADEEEAKVSALDATFITLRKYIKSLVLGEYSENNDTAHYNLGKHWMVSLSANSDKTEFNFTLNYDSTPDRRGAQLSYIEKALDELGYDKAEEMFVDFLKESFTYSNFGWYGKGSKYYPSKNRAVNEAEKKQTIYKITSEYPIIVTHKQLEEPC